jgi:hypothetical protein
VKLKDMHGDTTSRIAGVLKLGDRLTIRTPEIVSPQQSNT